MYSGPRRDQGMRQGNQNNNNKRMRGRNRSGKGPNPLTRSFESNGPDVKIRGTALHIAEKYGQLARDAHSSGDRIAAESYYQHAEHYYRIIAAAQAQMPFPQQQVFRNGDDADEEIDEFGNPAAAAQPAAATARPDRTVPREANSSQDTRPTVSPLSAVTVTPVPLQAVATSQWSAMCDGDSEDDDGMDAAPSNDGNDWTAAGARTRAGSVPAAPAAASRRWWQ